MARVLETRLNALRSAGLDRLLRGGYIGLEKESLRVTPDGQISSESHPQALGSPLTHPWVTTDYSEALLEFVTPPCENQTDATDFLCDVQAYVYQRLQNEMLWATSMPCVLAGDEGIPIARYGTSNSGTMKNVYRRGLGYRYGRVMQVISGVHFNYSLDPAFWPVFQDIERDSSSSQDFVSNAYVALIRNSQRFGWLIPYLFGASPAVCKSFFAGKESKLSEFDAFTYYEPYATSLRVSDIGYQNAKEKKDGLHVCYDDLAHYIDCLTWAIETPHPGYQAIGVVENGEYKQLNANILQIENEYYSSIRPKQIPERHEKPVVALRKRGVRYVELRSLDVNAFEPIGVRHDQLRFLQAYLIYCLLEQSPGINETERMEIDANLGAAAKHGREPGVELQVNGEAVTLKHWAERICDDLVAICEILDGDDPERPYSKALAYQREAIRDPERTPSARILAEMRANGESFYELALRLSQKHSKFFLARQPAASRISMFDAEASASHARQRQMEIDEQLPFAEFLERYFAGKL